MFKRFGRGSAERGLPSGWREDILAASDIVQDDDETVDADAAERRFDEFMALLDLVHGNEDDEVFRTLLRCMRPQADYGAYERLLGRLASFPPERRGRLTAEGLPDVIRANRDMAAVLLVDLSRAGNEARDAFLRAAWTLPWDDRREVARLINDEVGGWLRDDDLFR